MLRADPTTKALQKFIYAIAKEIVLQANFIMDIPEPHPAAGEYPSPPVGGDGKRLKACFIQISTVLVFYAFTLPLNKTVCTKSAINPPMCTIKATTPEKCGCLSKVVSNFLHEMNSFIC
jgi:hypothetical protein